MYESKYGNTRTVAEEIAKGIRGRMDATVIHVDQAEAGKLSQYDLILVGAPNHMGGPIGSIKRFIRVLGKSGLGGKKIAVFDTYMGNGEGQAVKKMEERISKEAPQLQLISPGLSIRVEKMDGPISKDELPKCAEFGRTIAGKI